MDEKMKEIRNLIKQAEVVMYHYLDNSSSDDCIFNKYDLWEQRHKTLCEVMEILER